VTLTKDPSTNRILAVGSPRAVEGIGELIASLDLRCLVARILLPCALHREGGVEGCSATLTNRWGY